MHHTAAVGEYLVVFGLVIVESFGIPLPGETALIGAATIAGTTHHLSIVIVILAALLAAALGGAIGYVIGRTGGYRLLLRYGRYIRVKERELKMARYLFAHQGIKVVFFGRFISILRSYAAFLAGAARMPVRRFLIANTAGGTIWAVLYGLLGFYAGNALKKASGTVDLAVGGAAVVLVVTGILIIRRRMGAIGAKAELEYPGPLEA